MLNVPRSIYGNKMLEVADLVGLPTAPPPPPPTHTHTHTHTHPLQSS